MAPANIRSDLVAATPYPAPIMGVRLAFWLSMLGIGLSPLYLWSSGLPQLSHILLAVAFGLYLLAGGYLYSPRWFVVPLCFVCYAFITNSVVFLTYNDVNTAFAAVYYLYNFAVFALVVSLAAHLGQRAFLLVVKRTVWLSLVITVCIGLFAPETLHTESRKTSTFNDPNQYAHWLMWATLIIVAVPYVSSNSLLSPSIAIAIAGIGILQSLSRTGALGLLIIMLAYTIELLRKRVVNLKALNVRVSGKFLIAVILVGLAALCVGAWEVLHNRLQWTTSFIADMSQHAKRLHERFIFERDYDDTFKGRGYDRIWKMPEYLILGAGEGAAERFQDRVDFTGEIHSTIVGVWFYYGIPGLLSFLWFVYLVWKNLPHVFYRLLMLAPLANSVGIYNARNTMFWIGLAVLYVIGVEERRRRASKSVGTTRSVERR